MGEIIDENSYIGKDAASDFLKHSLTVWEKICPRNTYYPIDMTPLSNKKFMESTHCLYCGIEFTKYVIKCRHHLHSKEKDNFIGALCTSCNFLIRKQPFLVSVSHNSSYDCGLLIKYASNQYKWKFYLIKLV